MATETYLSLDDIESQLFGSTGAPQGPPWASLDDLESQLFSPDPEPEPAPAPVATEPPPNEEGVFETLFGSFERSLVAGVPRMFGSFIESIGNTSLRRGGEHIARAGQDIQSFAQSLYPDEPTPPTVEKDGYLKTGAALLGSGLGTTVPSILTGGGASALKLGGQYGPKIAAVLSSAPLNIGETNQQLQDEGIDPEQAGMWAIVSGVPITALDVYGLEQMGVLGQSPQAVKRGIVTHMAREISKGTAGEATTETGQSLVREGLAATLTGNPDWENRIWRAVEEGIAGGLVGGTISGATAPFSRKGMVEQAREQADTTLSQADLDSPLPNADIEAGKRLMAESTVEPAANQSLGEFGLPGVKQPAVWRQADGTETAVQVTDVLPSDGDAAPAVKVRIEATGEETQVDLPLVEGQSIVSLEQAQTEQKSIEAAGKDIEQLEKQAAQEAKSQTDAVKLQEKVEGDIDKAAGQVQQEQEQARQAQEKAQQEEQKAQEKARQDEQKELERREQEDAKQKAEMADQSRFMDEYQKTVSTEGSPKVQLAPKVQEELKREGYGDVKDLPPNRRGPFLKAVRNFIKTETARIETEQQESETKTAPATTEQPKPETKPATPETPAAPEGTRESPHGWPEPTTSGRPVQSIDSPDVSARRNLAGKRQKALDVESKGQPPTVRLAALGKTPSRDAIDWMLEKGWLSRRPGSAKEIRAALTDKGKKAAAGIKVEARGLPIGSYKPRNERLMGIDRTPGSGFYTQQIDGEPWHFTGSFAFQGKTDRVAKASKTPDLRTPIKGLLPPKITLKPVAFQKTVTRDGSDPIDLIYFDKHPAPVQAQYYDEAVRLFGKDLKFRTHDIRRFADPDRATVQLFVKDKLVGLLMPYAASNTAAAKKNIDNIKREAQLADKGAELEPRNYPKPAEPKAAAPAPTKATDGLTFTGPAGVRVRPTSSAPAEETLPEGIYVNDNPNGTFSFVGNAPTELSYRMKDGSPLTAEMKRKIRKHGPGLFKKEIQFITYKSPEEAVAAFQALQKTPAPAAEPKPDKAVISYKRAPGGGTRVVVQPLKKSPEEAAKDRGGLPAPAEETAPKPKPARIEAKPQPAPATETTDVAQPEGRGPAAVERPVPGGQSRPEEGSGALEGKPAPVSRVSTPERGPDGRREAGDRGTGKPVGDAVPKGSRPQDSGPRSPAVSHTPAGRGPTAPARPGPSPTRTTPAPRKRAGINYRITPESGVGVKAGEVQVYEDNVAAIQLVKKLEAENRRATPDEQDVLVKYRGWGGVKRLFGSYWTMSEAEKTRHKQLKKLLTDEEFHTASQSILNAHYTSPQVVKAMWQMAEHMGLADLSKIRVLEPAAGIGNFLGMAPDSIADRAGFTAIEMDGISAQITRQLYQRANVQHTRFEDAKVAPDFYDLVITNVPFHTSVPTDKKYNKNRLLLHDYFVHKSLALTRPGGLVVAISSHGTMDKKETRSRKAIAKLGDLVGAVRLPEDAFQDNANTTVTTDILVFRRQLEGETFEGAKEWTEIKEVNMELDERIKAWGNPKGPLNEYFAANRKMMLGKMIKRSGRWGNQEEPALRSTRPTVPLENQIEQAVNAGIPSEVMKETVTDPVVQEKELIAAEVEELAGIEDGTYTERAGKLVQRVGEQLRPFDESTPALKAQGRQIREFTGLVNTMKELLSKQQDPSATQAQIKTVRRRLNTQYDRITERNSSPLTPLVFKSKQFTSNNPDSYRLLALEVFDEDNGKAEKVSLFKRNTLAPPKAAEKPKTPEDALVQSLNTHARVNMWWMEKVSGIPQKELAEKLKGVVFHVPGGDWVTAEEYLSGDVRTKLEDAEGAAGSDPTYQGNVDALKVVQPADIPYDQIRADLGDTWIPTDVLRQYVVETMDLYSKQVDILYSPEAGRYRFMYANQRDASEVRNSTKARRTWGTPYRSFFQLMDNALNGGFPQVKIEGEFSAVETENARNKLQEIKENFQRWIWSDQKRADEMAQLYNRERNNIALRQYDGSHLTFPGMSTEFKERGGLRKHQSNAVWRIMSDNATYVGHEVGTGKTLVLVAAAMEARRLGVARRPLVTVPNDKVEDFVHEFRTTYPASKILVASLPPYSSQSEAAKLRRRRMIAQIALNDWDAVVMNHDSFEALQVSPQKKAEYMRQEIADMREVLTAAQEEKSGSARDIASALEGLENNLRKEMDQIKKGTDVASFDETGVDMVLVDEAHRYKNLYFATRLGRDVKGVSARKTGRSREYFYKTQYLHQTEGKIVMASGTPISNSVGELYNISRYLHPEELRSRGLQHFDNWASAYGEIGDYIEVKPQGGGFKRVTKFNKFKNVSALMHMVMRNMDLVSATKIKLKRPKIFGGGAKMYAVEKNWAQEDYQEVLNDRADYIQKNPIAAREENGDNMLKVTSDGRNAAIDMRMVSPDYPKIEGGKIDTAVSNVKEIYDASSSFKGTQVIFLDRIKGTSANPDYKPHQDIKQELIKAGIPADQVVSTGEIKGAGKKEKKAFVQLYNKVKRGDVRVLLASTERGGTGVNFQDLVVGIHNLDVGWNLANFLQRVGRGLRQGNKAWNDHKFELRIFNYATEGMVDAFMWEKVKQKEETFQEFLSGELTNKNQIDDISDEVVTPAEMMAIASGDPMVANRVRYSHEKQALERSKYAFDTQQGQLRRELRDKQTGLPRYQLQIETSQDAAKFLSGVKKLSIEGGATFDVKGIDGITNDMVEAWSKHVRPLIKKMERSLTKQATVYVLREQAGTVEGPGGETMTLELMVRKIGDDFSRTMVVDNEWRTNPFLRVDNLLFGVLETVQQEQKSGLAILKRLREKDIPELEKQLARAWPKEKQLQEVTEKLNEIQAHFDRQNSQNADAMGDVSEVGGKKKAKTSDGEHAFAGAAPTLPSVEEASRSTAPAGLVRRSDILRKISQSLKNIPIRVGRVRRGKALGIYKTKPEVIRLKSALDIPVAAHELGHHINKIMYGGENGKLNYRPLQAFRDELVPIATPADAGKSPLPEGFAEFIRLYITRPDEAQAKAPKFHQAFEHQLEDFQNLRDLLADVRDQVERYTAQPAAAKVLAHISKEDTVIPTNRFARLYAQAVDAMHPIKRAVDALAKEQGGAVPPTEANAYELSRLFAGWIGKAEHFLKSGTFNANSLKVVGKPLEEILRPLDGQLDVLRIYLTARRAVEKHGQGVETGIEIADARAALKQVETPELKQAAEDIYQYNTQLLEYMVESKFLSEEQRDAILDMNQNYVPFYRVFEGAPGGRGGPGQNLGDLWNPVARMKGSTREIVDPLESIIKNTYTFINLAERNRVGQALVEQAEQTEGAGQWVEKIPPNMVSTSFSLKEISKTLEDAGVDMATLNQTNLETVATIFRPLSKESQRENIVSVFKDGNRELYQIHPDLYRAMKGLDREESNILIRLLSKPASALRLGATAISPEFMSRNVLRDAMTAFTQSRNGFIPGVDTFRGVFHALKRDDLYREWQRAGGEHAAMVSLDRTRLRQNLQDMLASPLQMVVRHPIETLRWLSEIGEAGSRLGEYGKARKRGKTPRQAAYEAREVTLDFARIGATTAALNKIVAFWNASLQGTDKFVRVHMDNPKGTVAKGVAGITIPSLILYALNHDDEDYQDLPTWQKDFFWMIPVKGTPMEKVTPFIPIPKPFLWGLVYGTSVERVGEWIRTRDPGAFKGFLNSLNQATMPSYIPTAVSPIIEWWANKSMFSGRSLVPGYLSRLPAEYQHSAWTSEFSKNLARVLKRTLNMSVSPIKIDNTIFGYSAGAGRAVLNVTNLALQSESAQPPTRTAADIPGVRAFVLRSPSTATESVQRLYDRLGVLEKKKAAAKHTRKYQLGEAIPLEPREWREYRILKYAAKRLSRVSLMVRRIEVDANISAEEKRGRIDKLNRSRVEIARQAVRTVRELLKAA